MNDRKPAPYISQRLKISQMDYETCARQWQWAEHSSLVYGSYQRLLEERLKHLELSELQNRMPSPRRNQSQDRP